MAVVVGSLSSPIAAFTTSHGLGRCSHAASERAHSRVRRLASPRSKLESEASVTADFVKAVQGFFGGGQEEPSKAQLAAEARRQEASLEAEKTLQPLRLAVIAGTDDSGAPQRRPAPIGVLQEQAKQSIAIFAATTEQALQDVLLSMRISAREFEERNLLVVPALVSLEERSLLDLSPSLQSSRFVNMKSVALPSPKKEEDKYTWGELLAAEFDGATDQGYRAQAEAQGLAILLNSDGQIVRRGVGRPDWQVIFNELNM